MTTDPVKLAVVTVCGGVVITHFTTMNGVGAYLLFAGAGALNSAYLVKKKTEEAGLEAARLQAERLAETGHTITIIGAGMVLGG